MHSQSTSHTIDYTDIEDPISVYVIVNGSLRMSPGKIAAQTLQAYQRLLKRPMSDDDRRAFNAWETEGTRTITKMAETQSAFDRACRELPGAVMIDEGHTEIPADSATVFATVPLRRSQLPTMLKHKRIRLLTPSVYDAFAHEPAAV